MSKFSENLKVARKAAGLTQNDLAEAIGVTPEAICNYETGKSDPRVSSLVNIAKALNLSVDALLGYEASDKFCAAADITYIRKHTTLPDALAQLAEEAAEVAQAALKLRRAIVPKSSPTPVKTEDALAHLYEELADVRACAKVLDLYDARIDITAGGKIRRWAKRLRERKERGAGK